MKYFSELTKKVYDSVEDLEKAEDERRKENEVKELAKQERAEAAKKVEEAFKEASEANEHACKLLDEFLKKYGTFHKTYTKGVMNPFSDWFNLFW